VKSLGTEVTSLAVGDETSALASVGDIWIERSSKSQVSKSASASSHGNERIMLLVMWVTNIIHPFDVVAYIGHVLDRRKLNEVVLRNFRGWPEVALKREGGWPF
jgi:hypothetical protein